MKAVVAKYLTATTGSFAETRISLFKTREKDIALRCVILLCGSMTNISLKDSCSRELNK